MENDQIQGCSKTVCRSNIQLPGPGRSVSLLFKLHHLWSFSGWFVFLVSLIISLIIHSKDGATGILGWLISKSQQSKRQTEVPRVTFNITLWTLYQNRPGWCARRCVWWVQSLFSFYGNESRNTTLSDSWIFMKSVSFLWHLILPHVKKQPHVVTAHVLYSKADRHFINKLISNQVKRFGEKQQQLVKTNLDPFFSAWVWFSSFLKW